MILYHVTHRRNVPSILARGLLPSKSSGKLKAVWCVEGPLLAWATAHVSKRHGWPLCCLRVIRIITPRRSLTKTARPKVWTCPTTLTGELL